MIEFVKMYFIKHKDTLTQVKSMERELPDESSSSVEDSLGLLFHKEFSSHKILLSTIRSDLVSLRESYVGISYLTSQQELTILSLKEDSVPGTWLKVSYPTTKSLSSYIDDLRSRIQYLNQLPQAKIHQKYRLDKLTHPKSLFTAIKLDHAAKKRVEFQDLKLDFYIRDKKGEDEFQIDGFYLESAQWNPDLCRIEDVSIGVTQEMMPAITVQALMKEDFRMNGRFVCPIYQTSKRERNLASSLDETQFVEEIYLDCVPPTEQWILKGVALIIQRD